MAKSTQYTDFIGLESAGALSEAVTTTFCQCPASLQWTITSHKAVKAPAETAWSLAPFCYTPNNQPCLCLRYRNMEECGAGKIKTTPATLDSMKPSKRRGEASLSISKNLKFGIERILNQSCSSDLKDDRKEQKNKNVDKSTTSSKSRRKNGTRSVFSHVQRNILELHYQQREYVTKGERYHIAMATGISEEQVKIWFQNRRTKKKKMERNKMATTETGGNRLEIEHCGINY